MKVLGIVLATALIMLSPCGPNMAFAGIGAGGSTGVLDVDTPEMLPSGWMSFSSGWSLDNVEIGKRRLHTFRIEPSITVGLNGGLEASAVLPLHTFYRTDTSDDGVSSLFDEDFSLRLSDLELKLKRGFPIGGERFRFGLQALATAPVGSDRVEAIYAEGDSIRPYTSDEWNVGGQALMTLDLTGPQGIPLRLHGNAGYYWNRNEGQYAYRRLHSYPISLGTDPAKSEDNDLLLAGVSVEFPAFRQAAFVELTTEQFVNQRTLLKPKENPILLTPGARFNLPGGVGLTTAISFNLSGDDDKTAFDPSDVYPDWQVRAVLSLGDIFQSRKTRLELQQKLTSSGGALPTHAPTYAETPMSTDVASTDITASVDEGPVDAEASEESSAPDPSASPALSSKTDRGVPPEPAVSSRTSEPSSPALSSTGDWDGDGILDVDDRCPRVAEDRDGFRDSDGCPDLDNDADGILDPDDLCPNMPEDYLGPNPLDGCPSSNPTPATNAQISRAEPGAASTGSFFLERDRPRSEARTERDRGESAAYPARTPVEDFDDDGIPDSMDRCPSLPEDPDGFEDTDGCPDRDNDGDGVLDIIDACPNAPETFNGYQDSDGCPDVVPDDRASSSAPPVQRNAELFTLESSIRDIGSRLDAMQRGLAQSMPVMANDAHFQDHDDDGIADAFDRCPQIPEDVDGWEDSDGCPDLDNDGDGILDSEDECDNAPETFNSFEDEDGCPDDPVSLTGGLTPNEQRATNDSSSSAAAEGIASPLARSDAPTTEPFEALRREATSTQRVFFPSGGASLSGEAKQALRSIARAVEDETFTEIDLVGHTDSRGASEKNLEISRQRAGVVRDFLVAEGVAADRIRVIGRGEFEPIEDNATDLGRSRNRRVDVVVTTRSR